MVTRYAYALAAAGVLGLLAVPARALTMADLITPGASPIVVGDKVFSNFNYASAALPADQVTVTQLGDGLRFTGGWNTSGTPIVDSVIQYDLTVTNGNALTGTTLTWGTAQASGGAVASVGETVTDHTNGNKEYKLQIITDGAGPIPDTGLASVTLDPATTNIHVVKDITVTRGSATVPELPTPAQAQVLNSAAIDFVDNTYVQGGGTPPPIPEPATLALVPLALVGLGLRRKLVR